MPAQTTVATASNDSNDLLKVLYNQDKLTQEQVKRIQLEHINTGKSYEELLSTFYFLAEKDILEAKSKIYNIPFISMVDSSVSTEAMALLPESVARRFKVYPFKIDKKTNSIHLVMEDPLNLESIMFLEKKTGQKIIPYYASSSEILKAID
jgi:type IV pilus assembly protein PilB